MTHLGALLLAAVLLVGSVSAVPTAGGAPDAAQTALGSAALQADANASDLAPGERLAGVVGAGQAEFEGELELRAYGLAYASARSDHARAAVVADRLDGASERFEAMEQRRATLEEARANGSISEQEYRARATELAARAEHVRQVVAASEARADALPADVLEANGVDATTIETLRADAANLTGSEVSAVARSIAGDDVGRPVSVGPPDDVAQGGAGDGAPDGGQGGANGGDGRPDDAGAAANRTTTT